METTGGIPQLFMSAQNGRGARRSAFEIHLAAHAEDIEADLTPV